jgi:hypothetical protein
MHRYTAFWHSARKITSEVSLLESASKALFCMYVCMCVCVCVYMWLLWWYIYVCVCLCMYVCMHVCVCMLCICTLFVYVYIYRYICLDTHVHLHTTHESFSHVLFIRPHNYAQMVPMYEHARCMFKYVCIYEYVQAFRLRKMCWKTQYMRRCILTICDIQLQLNAHACLQH